MDSEHIRELFGGFGALEVRRLFGGAGLFADGVMFGLVSGGEIYLKADAGDTSAFEREGCGPFEYGTKHGRRTIRSFWRLPERLYDDADELAQWARVALAVAQRQAAQSARKRTTSKSVSKRAKKRKR